MIIDHIRNRALYYSMGEKYRKALDYFALHTNDGFIKEDITLDGGDTVIKKRLLITKHIDECRFEAHKRYSDIHFVALGTERIGYADIRGLTELSYDEDEDIMFLSGQGDYITLKENCFLIAFPDDAHMPCICADRPSELLKLVAKIKL